MQIEQQCTIIGCINKTYKNETSFIEVIEDPQFEELFPNFEKFETSDQDVIFIEDSTGRVELKVKDADLIYDADENLVSGLTIGKLVDGLVVAVQGVMNAENKIDVSKVILPGLSKGNHGHGLKREQIKLDPPHST